MKKAKIFLAMLATLTFSLAICGAGSVLVSAAVADLSNNPNLVPMLAPWLTVGIYAFVLTSDFQMPGNMAFSAPVVFTKGICANIQTSLNKLMGANAPEVKRTPVGYLQAITSPTNTAGLDVIPIDTRDGKKHKVDVFYAQRGTRDDIQNTYNNGCNPDISKAPFEDVVDITDVFSLKGLTFSEDEMRKLCEGDAEWISRQIAAHLDPFMVVLNETLIAKQGANFGNFADGTSTVHSRHLLNTVSSTNKSANYFGENMIMNDFTDIDAVGRPILIGNGKLRDYTRITEKGCCNSVGIDLGQAGNYDYYDDRAVGTILGNPDDFIGLAPGNVQLLTYNKYKGTYKRPFNGNYSKTTIMDPFTGLELDMRWKYDDCEEVWILTFSLWYNLFFLPADAFAANDPLEGVNYSLHYRATEAAI